MAWNYYHHGVQSIAFGFEDVRAWKLHVQREGGYRFVSIAGERLCDRVLRGKLHRRREGYSRQLSSSISFIGGRKMSAPFERRQIRSQGIEELYGNEIIAITIDTFPKGLTALVRPFLSPLYTTSTETSRKIVHHKCPVSLNQPFP